MAMGAEQNATILADLQQLMRLSDRPDLALNAAQNLGRLGPSLKEADAAPAVEMLALALDDISPFVRATAVVALGHLGPAAKLEVKKIAELLSDPDTGVKSSTLRALGMLGKNLAAGHQREVAQLLEDKDLEVKVSVAKALSCLGKLVEPETAGIASLLRDEHYHVRVAGLKAIETLGEDAAVGAEGIDQIMMSEAEPNDVRQISIQAMACLGKAADLYVVHLTELLHLQEKMEPDRTDRAPGKILIGKEAQYALCKLSGADKHDPKKKLTGYTSKALVPLTKMLREGSDDVRNFAYNTLVDMGMYTQVNEKERTAFESWRSDKNKVAQKK